MVDSLKTKKHNIGTEEAPKMAIIGDYWDQEMVTQVVDLLKEYEDLFPRSFSEMKGIVRSLDAMKIQLNLDAKPSKEETLSPQSKVQGEVCTKNWIECWKLGSLSPWRSHIGLASMVVQPKKTSDIRICVDPCSLNVDLRT
jgi:hypothetical protein